MTRACKAALERWIEEFGVVVIVVLVGISGFGLGRISALEAARPAVSIGEAPMLEKPAGMAPGGLIVASATGGTYYYPWCSGVGKIAPQNQVWFKSEAAAQDAGYRPAKTCKGLEDAPK